MIVHLVLTRCGCRHATAHPAPRYCIPV